MIPGHEPLAASHASHWHNCWQPTPNRPTEQATHKINHVSVISLLYCAKKKWPQYFVCRNVIIKTKNSNTTGNYMFKVNTTIKIQKQTWVSNKDTRKTPMTLKWPTTLLKRASNTGVFLWDLRNLCCHSGVSIINSEHISHFVLLFLLFTWNT